MLAFIKVVAAEITMLSVGAFHVVNVGQTISFDCQFHADLTFNLFDYPVLWRKAQLFNVADIGNSHGLETSSNDGILQVKIAASLFFVPSIHIISLAQPPPSLPHSTIKGVW